MPACKFGTNLPHGLMVLDHVRPCKDNTLIWTIYNFKYLFLEKKLLSLFYFK